MNVAKMFTKRRLFWGVVVVAAVFFFMHDFNGTHDGRPVEGARFKEPVKRWSVSPTTPNGKKVVITGGAGFIGSQLGHHLHKLGYEVVLIDNMEFGYMDNLVIDGKSFGTFIEGDVLDKRVRTYISGADALYHFAALSALPVCQNDPIKAMEVNVAGTAAMLEAARLGGVRRFLFASTSAVYENNDEPTLTESLAVNPHLHYSLSKYQSELLTKAVAEAYDMDTVIFRFFNVYGPHQDFRRTSPPFTSYIVRELVNKRAPILHSDGKQSRDYIYIDDLLSLVTLAMTTPAARGHTFNVASGKAYSVNEMYDIVAKRLGVADSIRPVFHDAGKFWSKYPEMFKGTKPIREEILIKEVNKHVLGSRSHAKKILGWVPKVDMESGLGHMVDFIKEKQASGKLKSDYEVAWK